LILTYCFELWVFNSINHSAYHFIFINNKLQFFFGSPNTSYKKVYPRIRYENKAPNSKQKRCGERKLWSVSQWVCLEFSCFRFFAGISELRGPSQIIQQCELEWTPKAETARPENFISGLCLGIHTPHSLDRTTPELAPKKLAHIMGPSETRAQNTSPRWRRRSLGFGWWSGDGGT